MVEIVHTILPSQKTKTLRCKERPYANRANLRKRRNDNDEELCTFMDNAQTHEIKRKRKYNVPMLLSFLIFYLCVINVIIKCDVSVSDVNKEYKDLSSGKTFRENPKLWHEHRHEVKLKSKNGRKGRTSSKRQADGEEKTPEAQELNKFYEFQNVTDIPPMYEMPNNVYENTHAMGYPHDLSSSPYFVKNINFNLRPERHRFHEKIVKLGVLLPADPNQVFSLVKVLPIIEMAVPAVTRPDGPLPGWTILVDYRDTRCSSVEGPLAAFEFYVNGSAGKQNLQTCFDTLAGFTFSVICNYMCIYLIEFEGRNVVIN